MRAVVIDKPGSIGVTTIDDPTPGPDQVIVAPKAAGICGTDIHIVDGEMPPTPYPITPGHEFGGEIAALGPGVTGWKEGDRVAVDPSLNCGRCHYCREGRGNLCDDWGGIGVTTAGASADYVLVPAKSLYRIPDDLSWTAVALIEPLSCAVRGYDRLPSRLGAHYLIYGAGTMGLFLLQLAGRAGASSVSVVDTNTGRHDLARQLGAAAVATSADELGHEDGWEVVIDATGVIAAIEDGLTRVRRAGTFLQFGVAPGDKMAQFSPFAVYNKEIDIIGSMAVLNSYQRAVELMVSGAIDADAMVSDHIPLTDYVSAVDKFRAGTGRKLQIVP